MSSLYIYGVTKNNWIPAVQTLRAALRIMIMPNSTRDAAAIADECLTKGIAKVGESNTEDCETAANTIDGADAEFGALVDPSLDDVQSHYVSAEDEDEGEAEIEYPEVDAYATALALMVQAEGNPLKAWAFARTLGHTASNEDFYSEVGRALVLSFPWLPALIEAT